MTPSRRNSAGTDGAQPKTFGPDPRFELGMEGSIELWLKADARTDSDQPACALAHGGTEKDANFRVMIPPDGKSVAMVTWATMASRCRTSRAS